MEATIQEQTMPEEADRLRGSGADPEARFDADSVRWILQHAAVEQQRQENELVESYSLAELEEMAAEARISSAALRAAIADHRRQQRADDQRSRAARDAPRDDWITTLEQRLPGRWPSDVRTSVLAVAGIAAISLVLLAFWMMSPTLFWGASLTLIVVSLLTLMGASPF